MPLRRHAATGTCKVKAGLLPHYGIWLREYGAESAPQREWTL